MSTLLAYRNLRFQWENVHFIQTPRGNQKILYIHDAHWLHIRTRTPKGFRRYVLVSGLKPKPGTITIPAVAREDVFSEFNKEDPNPLTNVRKKMLREDVFNVLERARPNMSAAAKDFWLHDLGCNGFLFQKRLIVMTTDDRAGDNNVHTVVIKMLHN